MDRECRTCEFFNESFQQETGSCHRQAPLCLNSDADECAIPWAIWPRVTESDWCGEWKKAE